MITFKMDATQFKATIDVLSILNEDVGLVFDADGISSRTMDSARIAIMGVKLDKANLKEYSCDGVYTIGIDTAKVKALYKPLKDEITLTIKDDLSRLEIKSSKVNLTIPLLGAIDMPKKIPTPDDCTIHCTLPKSSFKEALDLVSTLGDALTITSTLSSLVIKGKVDEYGAGSKAEYTIPTSELTFDADYLDDASASYAISYLNDALKQASVDTLTLHLADDYPMFLDFIVKDVASVRFVLAPRISTD